MSIEEKRVEEAAAAPAFTKNPGGVSQKHWYTVLRSPLWLCLLVALLIRIWLTYHTHGVIDGDEAMVGIQAEHILRGEHPIYYYGQPYMGSLEAYLMAILFAIAGASAWMLRAEPILLSLVVVWLTWRLAGVLADAAQLSPFARQVFQTLAALFAAIPPLYDTVLQLRTLGGYIETFVLTLFLLLSVFQLTRRWHAGASNKELMWRWAGIGLIVGLGLWVNPLIAAAILAAAIWIVGFCLVELSGASGFHTERLKGLLLAAAAMPTCLIGMAPALLWGIQNHWENFTYALQLGSMSSLNNGLKPRYHDRLSLLRDTTYLYQHYVAPRVISGAIPTESTLLSSIHVFTLIVGLCCIFICVLLLAISLFWHHPQLMRIRQLIALPLLFAICAAIAFCTSISSTAGLISFQHDIVGRYATPLMLVLPFFFATVFTLASVYLYNFARRHALKARTNGRMAEKQISPRTPKATRFTISLAVQVLLFALLFTYLGAQVSTYALTDPDLTYQSASCPIAPANDEPIIAYLQHEHVHYAWAITWIGNPIIFKTNDGIIMADPRTILANGSLGRVPAYDEAVLHANRPAMLTMVPQDEAYPPLLSILDSLHVTYHTARFPSEPGYQVLVVTSLSRTVSILESKDFAQAFPGCI
ncbi:MAG: hypothetical protein NVSMB27_43690 [Ktedonobacteraceae bacterium]